MYWRQTHEDKSDRTICCKHERWQTVIGNSEVSEVLVKPKSSQEHATIDTLMNYSIIIGTAKLQGLTVKASSLVELENFIENLWIFVCY